MLFIWLGEKENMSVLTSPIPKDLALLDRDAEALRGLFTELEKKAEKVEELVESDNLSDPALKEQVMLGIARKL